VLLDIFMQILYLQYVGFLNMHLVVMCSRPAILCIKEIVTVDVSSRELLNFNESIVIHIVP